MTGVTTHRAWRPGGIALTILLLVLAAAIIDAVLTIAGALAPLDRSATAHLYGFRSGWLVPVMVALTLLGEDPPLDVFAVAVAVWAYRSGNRLSAFAMICVALAARIVGVAMKELVRRPRPLLHLPPHPLTALHGYGYPSGHAVLSMAILGFGAGLLLKLLAGRIGGRLAVTVCAVLIIGIGWSRVYLGFHWLNDVVGGYLDGATVALAGRLAEDGVRSRRARQV
jgi:membrane-associated phospholipid phosphatase